MKEARRPERRRGASASEWIGLHRAARIMWLGGAPWGRSRSKGEQMRSSRCFRRLPQAHKVQSNEAGVAACCTGMVLSMDDFDVTGEDDGSG